MSDFSDDDGLQQAMDAQSWFHKSPCTLMISGDLNILREFGNSIDITLRSKEETRDSEGELFFGWNTMELFGLRMVDNCHVHAARNAQVRANSGPLIW